MQQAAPLSVCGVHVNSVFEQRLTDGGLVEPQRQVQRQVVSIVYLVQTSRQLAGQGRSWSANGVAVTRDLNNAKTKRRSLQCTAHTERRVCHLTQASDFPCQGNISSTDPSFCPLHTSAPIPDALCNSPTGRRPPGRGEL